MEQFLRKRKCGGNNSTELLQKTTRGDETEVSFLSQELRDFLAESKECQILYSNCEGAYPRRVFSTKDRTSLTDFVRCTLYFKDSPDWQMRLEPSECELVDQILDKIICLSQDYKFIEEIHLSVVWVYYFDFQLKTQNSTPLFKIFKEKSGNEAVFVDVFLTLHGSWDYYLDNAALPRSLLCVPRNGVYSFVGETNALDLEFVITKEISNNKKSLEGKRISFVPFCQVAIRPWLSQIWSEEKFQQIKDVLRKFFGCLGKMDISFFHAVVLMCVIWSKIEEFKNQPSNTTSSSFSKLSFMLLDIIKNSSNSANSRPKDILEQMTNCLNDENLKMLIKEITNFAELLKRPQKDWKKILESFFCLYRNSFFLLSKIPFCDGLLKILLFLLHLGEALIRMLEEKNGANCSNSDQENTKSNHYMASPKSLTPTLSIFGNPQPSSSQTLSKTPILKQ